MHAKGDGEALKKGMDKSPIAPPGNTKYVD